MIFQGQMIEEAWRISGFDSVRLASGFEIPLRIQSDLHNVQGIKLRYAPRSDLVVLCTVCRIDTRYNNINANIVIRPCSSRLRHLETMERSRSISDRHERSVKSQNTAMQYH